MKASDKNGGKSTQLPMLRTQLFSITITCLVGWHGHKHLEAKASSTEMIVYRK